MATEMRIPIGNKCASLAAQVAHITFYLNVLENYVVNNDGSPIDWGEVWRKVEKVSPDQWNDLRENLEQSYQRISRLFHANTNWNEDSIGGAMAIVVHSVCHLGEIRQALCLIAG